MLWKHLSDFLETLLFFTQRRKEKHAAPLRENLTALPPVVAEFQAADPGTVPPQE
jgi:hypothetical protein